MDVRRIAAIFQKDFVASIRDARILLALVVPLGLGLLYNALLDDQPSVPDATVAYVAQDQTQLPDVLISLAGDSLKLSFTSVSSEDEVRRQVEVENADLGFVLSPAFDDELAHGDTPGITLVVPESPSVGGSVAAALIDPALRQLAGQEPPATVGLDTLPPEASESVIDRVGERRHGVLTAAVMIIAMIGMFVVPMVLAEEADKKTLDALVLIASDAEVIVAKALFGLAYIALAVPLLLVVAELRPAAPLWFAVGLVLLSVLLVGLGLLLGGLLSASQLNTWGMVLIVPVLVPVLVVAISVPGWAETLFGLMPTTYAVRLALNGLSGETLFANAWISVGLLAAWCAVIYALLLWRLSRREA